MCIYNTWWISQYQLISINIIYVHDFIYIYDHTQFIFIILNNNVSKLFKIYQLSSRNSTDSYWFYICDLKKHTVLCSCPVLPCQIQESMLFSARKVSSACTGALTSDMALSVIEKTINKSQKFQKTVQFDLRMVHDTCLLCMNFYIFIYFRLFVTSFDYGCAHHSRTMWALSKSDSINRT